MRTVVLLIALMCAAANAQSVRTATGKPEPRIVSTPRAGYNSTAKDTTPFNCDNYRRHPHPTFFSYCQAIEASTIQSEARRIGRPGASTEIVDLPSLGSSEAKRIGFACIGGQAMKRLTNGWEQVSSPHGGWLRCRGG